jgi:hypothetical protein
MHLATLFELLDESMDLFLKANVLFLQVLFEFQPVSDQTQGSSAVSS